MKLTDEKFDEYLKYLNHLNDEYFPWQMTTARKAHIDEYGIPITKGEIYYTKPYNQNFRNLLKLSRQSMDQILFLIVEGNHKLQLIGKQFEKIQNDQLKDFYQKRSDFR